MEDFFSEGKIEGKVYDRRTLMSLYKLIRKGVIKTLESTIKEGKESIVVSAKDQNERWLALKIYRVEYCDFKTMWKYLVSDHRFERVRKNRWHIILNWAKREFKNMKTAFDSGVDCSQPIVVYNNVLVMSFIGENGIPAPSLEDLKNERLNWKEIYDQVILNIEKLLKGGLIHADLSSYNVLFLEKPYLIDFSHAVTKSHPMALDFLKRDLENINEFFKKRGVLVDDNLFEKLRW
ncbi:MAG: serine protein kinase RIO [Candidatus Aenigmarchaeota archaeon]|nr:serine protein kinase RIO [Candidatus Aenigmarchaeota archaeon]MCX8190876.1 serine protein kinase RIO [Candidatus Aenigmarchaeota archaeon]MDW8159878.1 serine protein kinase RIO [Candidatus Aenigmarchaeota archaeon]